MPTLAEGVRLKLAGDHPFEGETGVATGTTWVPIREEEDGSPDPEPVPVVRLDTGEYVPVFFEDQWEPGDEPGEEDEG